MRWFDSRAQPRGPLWRSKTCSNTRVRCHNLRGFVLHSDTFVYHNATMKAVHTRQIQFNVVAYSKVQRLPCSPPYLGHKHQPTDRLPSHEWGMRCGPWFPSAPLLNDSRRLALQVNELLKQKEDLIKERDQQVNQIMQLRNEVMEHHERIRASEADKMDLENEIHQLKDSIAAKRAEGERELRKKVRRRARRRGLGRVFW